MRNPKGELNKPSPSQKALPLRAEATTHYRSSRLRPQLASADGEDIISV
jgi:hypothetical protein